MIEHTHAHLTHLSCLSQSPFDSRLYTAVALSKEDEAQLLGLIDLLNGQFKSENNVLLNS